MLLARNYYKERLMKKKLLSSLIGLSGCLGVACSAAAAAIDERSADHLDQR